MNIKNRKTKLLNKNNKKTKPFFNNIILNQLNLKIFRKDSSNFSNSNIKNKNNENFIIAPNNYLEKEINEYNKNNSKLEFKRYRSITNLSLNKKNNSNIIFKNYVLGNDVILPLKTLNNYDYSNKPYYILNDSNKLKSLSPIERNRKIKTYNNSLNQQIFIKTLNNLNSYKKKRNTKFNKKLFLNICNSNKNLGFYLYDNITLNNCSNKNLDNAHFKNQKELNQLKSNSSNFKSTKRINSFSSIQCHNKKKNIFQIYNYLNNNNHNENKNQEIETKKDINNQLNKLFDNPNSFVYLMFNEMKRPKFNEFESQTSFIIKRRFNEYKKDLNKLEQRVRYELFNLKKQRVIGNEINMKGKINSTNTFFDLAFGDHFSKK